MLSSANPRTLFGRAVLAAVVGWTLGCARPEPTDDTSSSSAAASDRVTPEDRTTESAPLALARGLLGQHPALLRPLIDGDAQLRPDGARLRSPGWEARAHGSPGRTFATIERRADAPLSVGHSPAERDQVRIQRQGVRPVEGELSQGRIVYRGAFDATDVVVAASATRVEEFLLLHDDSAPTEYAWHVELPQRLGQARHEAGGLVFLDAEQRPRLRVPEPVLVDAEGRERSARLGWSAGQLTVGFDPAGLVYPVVLDPAFESAVWDQVLAGDDSPLRLGLALSRPAAAFDSGRGVTVLFGGTSGIDFAHTWSPETYEYDGTSVSNPSSSGPGRHSHAMAYDARHSVTVLFGGVGERPPGEPTDLGTNETWLWNGSTWSQACTTGCTAPPARFDHAMAYDSARGRVVVFGGVPNGDPFVTRLEDTWEWDGSTWIKRCGEPSPCGPPARSDHTMAFDAAHGEVLLYGGSTFDGQESEYPQDLWAWDGNTWTQKCTTAECTDVLPPGRSNASLTYDSHRDLTVLFGGWNAGTGLLADTWEWDGTEWTETANGTPTARYQGALVFDTPRRRAVYLGGNSNGGPESDIWEYHARGEVCASDLECETFHCVDGVCCEQSACGTCEVCEGRDPSDPDSLARCIPVTNAKDPDSCPEETSTCNSEANCLLDDGQPCEAASQCFSGMCVDGICCGDLCEDQCEACDVAGLLGICSPVTGEPHGDRTPCDGTGTECEGTCGGTNRTACVYPGENDDCGDPHCSGNSTVRMVCNGRGACQDGDPRDCLYYRCNSVTGACFQDCQSDDQCIPGAACHWGEEMCVPMPDQCEGLWEVKEPNGNIVDCRPYACEEGDCRHECDVDLDCYPTYRCDTSRFPSPCVPKEGAGGTGGSSASSGGANNGGAEVAGHAGTSGYRTTAGAAGDRSSAGNAGTTSGVVTGGAAGDVSTAEGGSPATGGADGGTAPVGTGGEPTTAGTAGSPTPPVAGTAGGGGVFGHGTAGEAGSAGSGALAATAGLAGAAGASGSDADGSIEELDCECRAASRRPRGYPLGFLGLGMAAAAAHRRRRRRDARRAS